MPPTFPLLHEPRVDPVLTRHPHYTGEKGGGVGGVEGDVVVPPVEEGEGEVVVPPGAVPHPRVPPPTCTNTTLPP